MDERKVISSTLRYGVIISSILIVGGMLIFVVLHYNSSVNIYAYNTSNINDIFNLNNSLNISLYGLIVLISLPVLIVGEQIIIYSTERDKIYILISLVVLSLMIFAIIIMPRLLH
ncbi:MAG: DUF1634 domain-containing protein [Sulfolobaceae archaeon]